MQYVHLGNSGSTVSRLALGCMSFGQPPLQGNWTSDYEASVPIRSGRWIWK